LEAQESHVFIRSWLKKRYGEGVSSALRIQYGGSLKPENARAIFEMEDVDGGLVGGASLDADAFGAIIIKAKEAKC
jgi:triosephosphate isomerase